MLAGWLAEPHVAEWWDDPEVELAEIREHIDSISVEPLIVELDGRPIGYLQSYDPHLEDGHPYQDQPFGTLGIDISIGYARTCRDRPRLGDRPAIRRAAVRRGRAARHHRSRSDQRARHPRLRKGRLQVDRRTDSEYGHVRSDGARCRTRGKIGNDDRRGQASRPAEISSTTGHPDRPRADRPAGGDPLRDGPHADLHLRLRQALARDRAELGEFAADLRLVHLLAHHPRLPVLRALWLVPFPRLAVGLRLALAVVIEGGWELLENSPLHHRPLPRGHDLARLLRRQHHQFGVAIRWRWCWAL